MVESLSLNATRRLLRRAVTQGILVERGDGMDKQKMAAFIVERRRAAGLTQQQVADALGVSFQAVSKWEGGLACPQTEVLAPLAAALSVTVDELLRGEGKEGFTYRQAGVDVHATDAIKRELARYVASGDPRVLNGLGPFASLYDFRFDDIPDPVLVLKAEEPGSKQKLAMEYGYMESVCHDMVNHLVNDVIVMGARPLAVLDTIVCGQAEPDTIRSIVKGVSEACRANGCALVGGETSVQPDVVGRGVYILTASAAGVVSRAKIIDGSAISESDVVLAIASNGLHTNGYSLVRLLMKEMPGLVRETVNGESFIEAVMKPHTAYRTAVEVLLAGGSVHGLAHITGGGIEGNLCRVVPEGLSAVIDLAKIRTLSIFELLRARGGVRDEEMLRTFNCGVGLIAVVPREYAEAAQDRVGRFHECYAIGEIRRGGEKVVLQGNIRW